MSDNEANVSGFDKPIKPGMTVAVVGPNNNWVFPGTVVRITNAHKHIVVKYSRFEEKFHSNSGRKISGDTYYSVYLRPIEEFQERIDKEAALLEEKRKQKELEDARIDALPSIPAKDVMRIRSMLESQRVEILRQMEGSLSSLSRTIENATKAVKEDPKSTDWRLNSLGLFQGTGPQMDVLCSKLAQVIDFIEIIDVFLLKNKEEK